MDGCTLFPVVRSSDRLLTIRLLLVTYNLIGLPYHYSWCDSALYFGFSHIKEFSTTSYLCCISHVHTLIGCECETKVNEIIILSSFTIGITSIVRDTHIPVYVYMRITLMRITSSNKLIIFKLRIGHLVRPTFPVPL